MLCPASTGSVTHSSPYHSSRRQPGESTTLFSLEDFLPRSHLVPPPSLHSCQITLHCQQAHSHLRRAPPHRLPPTAVARSAGRLLLWFLKSLVIARILRHQPPIQVEEKPGRAPRHHWEGGQVVLSGKLADQSRLLLRRGSQRSVGQLLLVMDVVQHEDRLSRKTRSLTLEPASLQGSLSTANRNHIQPDSQIARNGTFKSWLLFCIMTRPFHIESELNRVPCRGPRTLSSIYKGGSRKIIKSCYRVA